MRSKDAYNKVQLANASLDILSAISRLSTFSTVNGAPPPMIFMKKMIQFSALKKTGDGLTILRTEGSSIDPTDRHILRGGWVTDGRTKSESLSSRDDG